MRVRLLVSKEWRGTKFHRGEVLNTLTPNETKNSRYPVDSFGFVPDLGAYKVWSKNKKDWFYFHAKQVEPILGSGKDENTKTRRFLHPLFRSR